MIRYTAIHMGPCCTGRCAFCPERGGSHRTLPELLTDVENAQRPLNLFFTSGHAAGSPALGPLLQQVLLEGPRRLKVRVSGADGLAEKALCGLLAKGVMLYELECLGPTADIHDGITGIPGSFHDIMKTLKQLTHVAKQRDFGRPFVSLVMPICPQNIRSLREMSDRAAAWRPDRMVFLNTGSTAVSRVILEIQAILPRLVAQGIWPVLSGFPFCALSGLEYYAQELYDRQMAQAPAPLCEGCIFIRACSGVSASYLAEYGAAEFRAVAWHRQQLDILRLTERSSDSAGIGMPEEPEE